MWQCLSSWKTHAGRHLPLRVYCSIVFKANRWMKGNANLLMNRTTRGQASAAHWDPWGGTLSAHLCNKKNIWTKSILCDVWPPYDLLYVQGTSSTTYPMLRWFNQLQIVAENQNFMCELSLWRKKVVFFQKHRFTNRKSSSKYRVFCWILMFLVVFL